MRRLHHELATMLAHRVLLWAGQTCKDLDNHED